MSRTLRRPMFRGGPISSDGNGITSGLDQGYADGGRVGLGLGGWLLNKFSSKTPSASIVSGAPKYEVAGPGMSMQVGTEAYKPTMSYSDLLGVSDLYKSASPYLANPFIAAPVLGYGAYEIGRLPGRVTGSDYLIPGGEEEKFVKDFGGEILGKETSTGEAIEGYYLTKNLKRAEDLKNRGEPGDKEMADKLIKSSTPQIKPTTTKEGSIVEKDDSETKTTTTRKEDFKTIYDDLLPIFKSAIGPDQDHYTRQKYLELAKFGLNLLKPTPAGVKPSLLSSAATAAEKPLEGYGAILEKERQAARLPEMLALQEAVKLSEPGPIGKAIKDLVRSGVAKDEKEAIRIYQKAETDASRLKAQQVKELEKQDLQSYEALKTVKDPAVISQLADLIYEDKIKKSQIKGDAEKFKKIGYEEGKIYIDKGKIVKYKNGQFYTPDEKGF